MSSSFILSWWVKSIFLCLNNKILIELIVPELKQSLRGYSVHVPLCPKAKYAFLMHQSIWSFNILPFPLDNPWEFFTVFHALGVGNLNLAWVGWGGGGNLNQWNAWLLILQHFLITQRIVYKKLCLTGAFECNFGPWWAGISINPSSKV